ncbi:unnamed protein product [Cochlearia groenlandica]
MSGSRYSGASPLPQPDTYRVMTPSLIQWLLLSNTPNPLKPPEPPDPPDPPNLPSTQAQIVVIYSLRLGFSCRYWSPLTGLLSSIIIETPPQVVDTSPSCSIVALVPFFISFGDTIYAFVRVFTALCSLWFQIRCLIRPWMLLDHLNGDSNLPCIEVFIRHVLILHIAKGFVPFISICVYGVVDAKWEVCSLFRVELCHLGTLYQSFFPKFPLVWSGLDDQTSSVLQGSSSRLIVFFVIVAELVTFRVASDVSHEVFEFHLKSIPSLALLGLMLSTCCLLILYFYLVMIVIPHLLSEKPYVLMKFVVKKNIRI